MWSGWKSLSPCPSHHKRLQLCSGTGPVVNCLMFLRGIGLCTASATGINESVSIKTKLISFSKICIWLILQRSRSKLFLKPYYFNKEAQSFHVCQEIHYHCKIAKGHKMSPSTIKQHIRKISFSQQFIIPAEPRETSDISDSFASGEINVP